MNKAAEKLRDMKLHEELYINVYRVMRVVGGWIYTIDTGESSSGSISVSSVFVPYSQDIRDL